MQEIGQSRGRWRFESDLPTVGRVRQADFPSVQKHPFQALTGQRLVEIEMAVLVIADDRETEVRQVHTNLVRPPAA